ncbi:MAG: AmmeMemoRadiSam system protein B [Treponema sp.]|jgi:AmmeMemoRadiSam system protein B|nr:AmmeMemoRadiSam system protein B [Treponema sp.]
MTLRKRCLPAGWYPQHETQIRDFLSQIPLEVSCRTGLAAAVPHAGWFYSGPIAAAAIAALNPEVDTLVLIGGHLPSGSSPLFAEEDGAVTPLGTLIIDHEYRDLLKSAFISSIFPQGTKPDRYQDNTIEVLLPMASYFFPTSRILPFRLPNEIRAFEAGTILAQIGKTLGRKTAVIGSTDLTHYGANYGFAPYGQGKKALDWVREVNDKAFIQSVIQGLPEQILERADQDRSACSVGAVLGTLGFAQAMGSTKGELLGYGTSAGTIDREQECPDSFVGYAGIVWNT